MMTRRLLPGVAVVVACLAPRVAYAECVETAPTSGARPQMTETFPSRGTSGYDATLHVVVVHGRGETVLPRGLELQSESDAAKALKAAGFALPDQEAGAGARMTTRDLDAQGGRRETTVDLPLVALPSEPGRHSLTLPPVPIVVARASGDVVTLCTKPHSLVVDDPTASTPDAQPRGNPPPRSQREEWIMLERALAWSALGIAVGGALAWMAYRWTKRPKPVPPPPPPRVPWEVALERLHEVRHAGLLETSRFADFFDRVNDAVRQYLGARFGFDGLESTTDEAIAYLKRSNVQSIPLPQVIAFLQECDLVKFANFTPALGDCAKVLESGEHIVRGTMPRAPSFQAPPPPRRGK